MNDLIRPCKAGVKIADGSPDEVKRDQAMIDVYLGVAH
jgi:branched-chain amino acid transport system ATP-binding protein